MDANSFLLAQFEDERVARILRRAMDADPGNICVLQRYFREHHRLGFVSGPHVMSACCTEIRAVAQGSVGV